jgi:hypothetical protein
MGAISEAQLMEALRIKALWTAREMSLWTEGTYEFIASPSIQKLLPYGQVSLEIDVMRATMEVVRYSDEWLELHKFLPQGMRTMLQMSPAIPYVMRFEVRAIELLTHVNLYHRLRRIASALRRPELDVARDLAMLVRQRFLQPIYQEIMPRSNGRKVQLPDPAEKLRIENFQLLDLLSRMEVEWDKRTRPADQLPALVDFVNWTMDALAESCRANGVDLDPNTLRSLMINEQLGNMGTYQFLVDQNHIDVENFTALCYKVLTGDIKQAEVFYNEAMMVLRHLLCSLFEMINMRVGNPLERLENQANWETMFDQFELRVTNPPA